MYDSTHFDDSLSDIKLPQDWIKESQDGATRLFKVSKCDDVGVLPMVSHSVIINKDFTWSAHVRNICLDSELANHFPSELTFELIAKLASAVNAYDVCIGNPDEKFVEMVRHHRNSQILDRSRKSVVSSLDQQGVVRNGSYYIVPQFVYHHVQLL